jgi:DNA topoisomerase-2
MITEVDLPSDFTRVSFTPDLEKFGLESLTHDHIRILHRRCYDVAACVPTITVTLNDSKIPVACFRDYVKLFCDSGEEPFVVASPNKSRWEIAVKRSNDLGFEHMSFVNCMHTPRGGTHVASVTSQLCRAFEDALLKKGHKVLTSQVKSKLFVFVRAFVENPSFDSQTKEALTSPPRSLGSTFALSQRVLKHIVDESGIVDELVEEIRLREQSELLRKASSGGRKAITVNVPKLEDAYRAGTSSSSECTLILTEGDSAKALAIAGEYCSISGLNM